MHLMRLPALFAVYPDARVILTHRDPVKTVASSVSTLVAGRWVRSDDVDTADRRVGRLRPAASSERPGRAALPAARGPGGRPAIPRSGTRSGRCDRSAYGKLGLPFDPAMPDRIRAYLAARPQHKHGKHRYSAADFGLDPDEIRETFAPYTEAFNVALES